MHLRIPGAGCLGCGLRQAATAVPGKVNSTGRRGLFDSSQRSPRCGAGAKTARAGPFCTASIKVAGLQTHVTLAAWDGRLSEFARLIALANGLAMSFSGDGKIMIALFDANEIIGIGERSHIAPP